MLLAYVYGEEMWGDGEIWSASSELSCAFMIPCDARHTIEWIIELVQSS
jgi:hypothetical protein